jgi:hypothetical protein
MKLILFCLVLIFLIVPVNAVDWLDSDWKSRRNITINHSVIDAEMTNFPTMVSITQLGLNTGGNDIRITDSSGNQVAREIECYNATSGKLVFHFNGTSVSNTSDTSFWMYYNNSAATEPDEDSTYGSESVWDSNYMAVWHMNNDPSGAGAQLKDSTKYNHNGTSSGSMTSGDLVDGFYGKGIHFDGSDDCIETSFNPKTQIGDGSSYTTTVLFYEDVSKTGNVFYGHVLLTPRHYLMADAYRIGTGHGSFVYFGALTMPIQTYHVVTGKYDSSTDYTHHILDEQTDSTSNTGDKELPTTNMYIARQQSNYYDGIISEIRFDNVARSANYISTIHTNLNNPTATGTHPFFLSFGEEESYEVPLLGTFLYPNSTYSVGYYGRLTNELVYETGFNMSDIGTCNTLTAGDMEVMSTDDTNYIQSIDKDAARDGYMYGNFSLPGVKSINFINVKTVHNRNGTSPVILGLFNVSTQKWHGVNNSSVEIVDVELTYNITGTDIIKYSTLKDNVLNLSVSLNTNGDGNEDVFVDFVEVYIDYEEVPCLTLECVYNLAISNQNNISILQNDVDDLKNNVNNLYLFVLLCTVFLVATLRKRGN